nr:hypothetical protein [Hankyongella ginsenosidimutans]
MRARPAAGAAGRARSLHSRRTDACAGVRAGILSGRGRIDGCAAAAPCTRTGERQTRNEVYGLAELHEVDAYLRDLYAVCDVQGLPLEGAISEYSPGQIELTLAHKPDALRAADDAVLYKRAAKGIALNHGMEATFMAKPFADCAGSGLHIHVSVEDRDGRNIFADADPAGSPALRHAIGGLRETLADTMAILAPNANSYRRFRANSYAPTSPSWGSTTVPSPCVCRQAALRAVTSNTASPAPTPTPIWRSPPCWPASTMV